MPFIIKRLDQPFYFMYEKNKDKTLLYKTIRYNPNFYRLSQNLPESNYSLLKRKPINKASFIAEMKINKKNSLTMSEKLLKLPKLKEYKENKKVKVQNSMNIQKLPNYEESEESQSADSKKHYLKKKKNKIQSFMRNLNFELVI